MRERVFLRLGKVVRPIASITRIEEAWTPPERDPHPGRSPIPLDSVKVSFADGTEETFRGDDAEAFAAWYRPLCVLYNGLFAEDDPPPMTERNQSSESSASTVEIGSVDVAFSPDDDGD